VVDDAADRAEVLCAQAAAYLRVTVPTIRRLLRQGKLRGRKTALGWRIAEAELAAYRAAQGRRPGDPPPPGRAPA